MLSPSLGFVLLASAGLAECRSVLGVQHFHGRFAHKRQNEDATGTVLVASAIQTGSFTDGSDDGVSAPGQSKSGTSRNNFINHCAGKTLTNGLQVTEGSCNGISMGDIPSKQNMVSSMITFPVANSNDLEEDTSFSINVQMINFVPGSFTNAQETYYSAPQALSGGKIIGHTHVTVQDMGASLNPKQPLDATKFVFFKGINDAGNGNGLLSATVPGGLPAGNYRVCTMASSSNHQPVLMPVAQRGAQDDCTKFTIVAAGGGGNGGGNGGGDGSASSSAGSAESSTSTAESTASAVDSSTAAQSPVETSAAETSPAETSTAESSAVETSAIETSAIVTSSRPPFANSTIAATTTRRGGGKGGNGGRPPRTSTTKIALTTKAVGGNGNGASSPAPPATSTTTSAANNGNGAPPGASTTTKAANGGKGGKGGKGGNGGGKNNIGGIKGVKNNKPPKQIIKIVHKVTIIRTFFTFINSLGGLPPSVGKKGRLFAVLDELFDDLSKACDAACGHQYKTCISFNLPGFEATKCKKQRNECGAAASVVTSAPAETPKVITATVTVPPSASVTGEIIGEETVSSTVDAVQTTAGAGVSEEAAEPTAVDEPAEPAETGLAPATEPTAPAAGEPSPVGDDATETTAPAAGNPNPAEDSAACSIVTATVTVDPPALSTATALPVVSKPIFSNSTASATVSSAPAASSVPAGTGSGTAVAGIEAPAIEDSGDAARPFKVNGNTFVNEAAAVQRSCDIQFNRCADAVNGGRAVGVSVSDCSAQKESCGK